MVDSGDPTEEARDVALGRHLRALRRQRGWTQTTLHEKSGISEATIRSIEGNYPRMRRRSRSTLAALSRSLGLSNDYLANYRDNPPPEDLRSRHEAAEIVPQQSVLDVLARSMQEILSRINETVVPRLDRIEAHLDQLDMIVDTLYPGTRNISRDDGDGDEE